MGILSHVSSQTTISEGQFLGNGDKEEKGNEEKLKEYIILMEGREIIVQEMGRYFKIQYR